VDTFLHYLSVM